MNHKETGNSMFNEITTTRMNPYHVKERGKKKLRGIDIVLITNTNTNVDLLNTAVILHNCRVILSLFLAHM